MTDQMITRAIADPQVTVKERRIDLRMVRWGEVATQTAEGIRETFARGSFAGTDPASVILESQRHEGPVVGVAEAIEERDDGAYASFRVASTPAGDELLTLASEGIMRSASVVFRPVRSRNLKGGVTERQSVELHRVAILPRGAYPSAQVIAVRNENVTDPIVESPAPAVDLAPIIMRMDGIDEAIRRVAAAQVPGPEPAIVGATSLGDFARKVYRGELADDLIARTFADQITSQNDGINQASWITDVKRIVDTQRRAINAFGGPAPLPEKGMNITYPFLSSANTLTAVQSTQKTEVQSARVDIDDATVAVATYAGGSDISIQLLERGTPSYLESYQRIMLNHWAGVTDAAFVTALEAGSVTQLMGNVLGAPIAVTTSAHTDDIIDTSAAHGFSVGDPVVFTTLTGGDATTAALVNRVVWVTATSFGTQTLRVALTPGGAPITWGTADLSAGSVSALDATAAGLRATLAQASVTVETATGAPASVVLASTDTFLAFLGLTDVVPYGLPNASNASGLADAAGLRLNVSGLEIIHKSSVTAGKLIVSNRMCAQWLEDGPRWLTVDNAQKLGVDKTVYSFGAPMTYVPAGIIEVTFV